MDTAQPRVCIQLRRWTGHAARGRARPATRMRVPECCTLVLEWCRACPLSREHKRRKQAGQQAGCRAGCMQGVAQLTSSRLRVHPTQVATLQWEAVLGEGLTWSAGEAYTGRVQREGRGAAATVQPKRRGKRGRRGPCTVAINRGQRMESARDARVRAATSQPWRDCKSIGARWQ